MGRVGWKGIEGVGEREMAGSEGDMGGVRMGRRK